MNIKDKVKSIIFAILDNKRTILLDYANDPKTYYTKVNYHKQLQNIISKNFNFYTSIITTALLYKEQFYKIKNYKKVNTINPSWNAGHMPGLDMIMLYTIINYYKPKIYLEIGSGTSTLIVHKAIKENNLKTKIISIDPKPRETVDIVCNTIYRVCLHEVDNEIFKSLEPNDILFLDGSHMLLPNSDVMYFFLEVLPILKEGVIIHLHDIYLPYDYPKFMLNRYYNEQYILASTILTNPKMFEVICPNYFIYQNKELLDILGTLWEHPSLKNVEKHGGSFWFKKVLNF